MPDACLKSRISWGSICLIVLVGIVAYSNTMEVPFYFDDISNIQNPALRLERGSVDEISKILTTGTLKTRPMSNLSLALNYYLGGYRVQGYHLVNITIHVLAGIFLYLFLRITLDLPVNKRKYGGFPGLALLAAVLWLVHPLGTQSVTYIVQRMNSMAAMFYILAMLLYVMGRVIQMESDKGASHIPAWCLFIGSGLAGLLALGSKEIAATLPVFIFLYEWFFFQDLEWSWLRRKLYWLAGAAGIFSLLTFLYLGKAPWLVLFSDCPGRDFTAYERLLTQFRVVWRYISLLFYPYPERLALDYNFPFSTSLTVPISTLYAVAGIVLLWILGGVLARRERLLSFCLFWFFGNLVIESSVICLEMYFEHRTYLPSMMFFLFAVALLYRSISNTRVTIIILVLLSATWGYWTFMRNNMWRDPVQFWQQNITVSPDNFRPHSNLALALTKKGMIDQAEKELRIALAMNPNAKTPLTNLGNLLVQQERRKEAEIYYRRAIEVKPGYIPARIGLANLLRDRKQYKEALEQLKAALLAVPDNPVVLKNYGNTLLRSGQAAQALPILQKALLHHPEDMELLLDVAESLSRTEELDAAISTYQRALFIENHKMAAHYNLALLLQQEGKGDKALAHYRSAARLTKYPVGLLYNYGNELFRQGRFAEAEKEYLKFLNIMPMLVNTYNNLGMVFLNQEKYRQAVQSFTFALRINPGHALAENNLKMAIELMEKKAQKETIDQ